MSLSAFSAEVVLAYAQAYDDSWRAGQHGFGERFGVTALIVAVSAAINAPSLAFASRWMWLLTINAILAFTVLIGYNCAHIPSDASKRFENPVKQLRHANWSQLVGLLVFNSAGYDCALVVVSRIHEPKRTADE